MAYRDRRHLRGDYPATHHRAGRHGTLRNTELGWSELGVATGKALKNERRREARHHGQGQLADQGEDRVRPEHRVTPKEPEALECFVPDCAQHDRPPWFFHVNTQKESCRNEKGERVDVESALADG